MAPKRKRLDANKTAAEALEALSSDSSDDDELPVRYNNNKVPLGLSDSDSDSDDEPPVVPKKKKPAPKKKRTDGGKGTARQDRRSLKPLFDVGDEVYSSWWETDEDRRNDFNATWHPGTIQSYNEVEADGPFGPTRTYDVLFDDADELSGVEEHFVCPKMDYLLTMDKNGNSRRSSWKGVRIETASDSSNRWARDVDAMDAYDNAVIKRKGKNAKKAELNRPEKYSWLIDFSSSESEEESKGSKKKKGKGKGKGGGKGKGITSYHDHDVLMGGAVEAKDHPGNIFYRKLIDSHKTEYANGSSLKDEAAKVVASIRSLSPRGRFLRRKDNGSWVDIGDKRASIAVRNAVYDAAKRKRPSGKSPSTPPSRDAKETPSTEESVVSSGDETAESKRLKVAAAPAYKNVSYCKPERKYMAEIWTDKGKRHCLGYYQWEADAALAADKGCMLLGSSQDQNFANQGEYEEAIQKEVNEAGQLITPEISHEAVLAKVEVYLAQIIESRTNPVDYRELDGDEDRNVGSDAAPPQDKTATTASVRRSNYQDVSYCDQSQTFVSRIPHEGKQIFLGRYKLEAEAALAHDQAVTLLNLPLMSFNFKTKDIYNQAARRELTAAGPGVNSAMSAAAVESKVARMIARGRESSEEEASEDDAEGRKEPVYVGVSYATSKKKYMTSLPRAIKGKNSRSQIRVGYYELGADAAFARDEALRMLKSATKANFASVEDYENAKARELEKKGLGVDSSLSVAAISSKVAEMLSKHGLKASNVPSSSDGAKPTAAQGPKGGRKGKLSRFTGVTKPGPKSGKCFVANIWHGGNRSSYNLGYYKLEADAALAYDEAAKLLRGDDCPKVNFASRQDFFVARAKELGDSALTDQSMPDTQEKIQKYLLRIPCPELKALNDDMAKKWAHRLPSETGEAFLASYQTGINEELELANAMAPSIVSHSATDQPEEELDSVHGGNLNAYFKPIVEEDTADDSTCPSTGRKNISDKPTGDSDDDASLFGDREDEIEPTEDSGSLDKQNEHASASVDANQARGTVMEVDQSVDVAAENVARPAEDSDMAISSDDDAPASKNKAVVAALDGQGGALANDATEATQKKDATSCRWGPRPMDFPPGCPVMWGFEGNAFLTGTVRKSGGAGKVPVVEVIPTNSDGQRSSNETIQAKDLALAPNCPVYVSSTTGGEDLEGKVLFCAVDSLTSSDSYQYTILISKEANQFQMMQGVSPDRVKYRKVAEASPSKKNAASGDDAAVPEIDPAPAQQPETPASQPPTPAPRKSPEDNGSQASSQQFFSSNSTITTIDSTPASARRAGRGQSSSSSVDCRVKFPHWLVRNAEWQQSLLSHLNRLDLDQSIGKRTNCSLRIVEEGDLHVLIQTKQGTYAVEDLRRAKEDVEQALLQYIKHDGSCGRLFYDMARGCKLLHPNESTGGSVMQRNPFDPDMRMGWVNIVELPHLPNTKNYHGHYILSKRAGILGRIGNQTRCQIKICGNAFKVPTKYFRPYIWVTGDQPALVDQAVGILQGAIDKHRRDCNCVFD